MWFEELVGFKEINLEQVRNNIDIVDNKLISKVNGKEFIWQKILSVLKIILTAMANLKKVWK